MRTLCMIGVVIVLLASGMLVFLAKNSQRMDRTSSESPNLPSVAQPKPKEEIVDPKKIAEQQEMARQKRISEQKRLSEEYKPENADTIAFFYTGQLKGELEPCGCSKVKLGGILLRSGWINHLRKLYSSSIFFVDGGFSSTKWERQDQLKFLAYHRMLEKLNYTCRFSGKDENPAEGTVVNPSYKVSGEGKPVELATVATANHTWKIMFVGVENGNPFSKDAIERALIQSVPDILFIAIQGNPGTSIPSWIPQKGQWTVLFLVDAQEPFSPVSSLPRTLVISAGNRGRYAGLLAFSIDQEKSLQQDKVFAWKNHIISLQDEFDADPSVVTLFDQYKERVKEERLLELQIKRSSPIGFVGSDSCIECHKDEYELWKGKNHAKAFSTLVKEKHDFDPECVGCHTVGYEFEEGFRSSEITPHLIDVGCECCHGPGAFHIVNDKVPGYGKTEGEKNCLTCHEKNRSPSFEYQKYRELIKHWLD